MNAPMTVSEIIASKTTFAIPSSNWDAFVEKFQKIARRAKKLDKPEPSFRILKEEIKEVRVGNSETQKTLLLFRTIEFDTSIVTPIAGYEFAAVIEHTEEGNILHAIPGGPAIPHYFREVSSNCDHCKVKRKRNDTYIVRKAEDNTYVQVGSTCIGDFLNTQDASIAAAIAEIYATLGDLASACEDEGFSGGGSGPEFYRLERYLSFVSAIIRDRGWLSRSSAYAQNRPRHESTASVAYEHMSPTKEMLKDPKFIRVMPNETDEQHAKDAVMWAETLTDVSEDYLYTIHTIAKLGAVSYRHFGQAASIVAAYDRHIGELKRAELARTRAAVSEYQGEVGIRSTFTLNVEKVLDLPDYGFGPSSLHIMTDERGNAFVWKSSSKTFEANETVVVKATVKEHKEYTGKNGVAIKQTVLSRCTRVETKTFICVIGGEVREIIAENDKEAKKMLLSQIGVARMPKGATISLK